MNPSTPDNAENGSIQSKSRRLNIGGMPSAPSALLLIAALIVALTIASSWLTLYSGHAALASVDIQGVWLDAIAIILALGSLFVVRPLYRALKYSQDVRAAATRNDISAARVARSSAKDQAWIALGFSLGQLLVVMGLQFLLANDQAVAKTFFLVPLIFNTFPLVLKAFWVNIKIFLVAEVFVLIWGLIVALATFAPGAAGRPIRIIATAYIDIFRAIPAILVIYLVGFGIPRTEIPFLKDLSLEAFVVLALTLTVGAYVAEIYRAGILSIHWSQTAAARSLGLSHAQTLRYVVVPQGIRQIIPPLLNAFIALQKDTALVNVIGVIDSFNQSMLIAANYYNLSAVTTVALLFIVISIPQTRFVERMMQRDRKRMRAGSL